MLPVGAVPCPPSTTSSILQPHAPPGPSQRARHQRAGASSVCAAAALPPHPPGPAATPRGLPALPLRVPRKSALRQHRTVAACVGFEAAAAPLAPLAGASAAASVRLLLYGRHLLRARSLRLAAAASRAAQARRGGSFHRSTLAQGAPQPPAAVPDAAAVGQDDGEPRRVVEWPLLQVGPAAGNGIRRCTIASP